jgi:hypothetical protein
MADFFTPILVLVIYLIGFHFSTLSSLEKAYFILLAAVAVMAHVSHFSLGLALITIVVGLRWWLRTSLRSTLIATGLLLIPLGLAATAILLNNIVIHRVFSLLFAQQSFLLANMIEHGPAKHHLEEACPARGYRICAVVDNGNRFRVSLRTDAFEKLGGFKGMREESSAIVWATIRSRPLQVVRMAADTFGSALFRHSPGAELSPLSTDPWMVDVLSKKFGPATVLAYRESLQTRGLLPQGLFRAVDDVAFPAAVLALAAVGTLAFRGRLSEAVALAALVSLGFRTQLRALRIRFRRIRPTASETNLAFAFAASVDPR